MRKLLLTSMAILASCGAIAPATAQTYEPIHPRPTAEQITYAENVRATVEPSLYVCTVKDGSTYIQRRYYTSPTSYISTYDADTVSCTKLKRR